MLWQYVYRRADFTAQPVIVSGMTHNVATRQLRAFYALPLILLASSILGACTSGEPVALGQDVSPPRSETRWTPRSRPVAVPAPPARVAVVTLPPPDETSSNAPARRARRASPKSRTTPDSTGAPSVGGAQWAPPVARSRPAPVVRPRDHAWAPPVGRPGAPTVGLRGPADDSLAAFIERGAKRALTRRDRQLLDVAIADAMADGKVGAIHRWRNPVTQRAGRIVIAARYITGDGRHCRVTRHRHRIDGSVIRGRATLCQGPGGSWRIEQAL